MKNIDWNSVQHSENATKMFLFRPIATSKSYEYTGFPLEEFFSVYSLGMLSKNDSITISHTEEEIQETVRHFQTMDASELRERYSLKKTVEIGNCTRRLRTYKSIAVKVVFQR